MMLSLSSKKADVESGSNPLTQVSNPRELKRQRDRARLAECHAAMTKEQLNEINRKRREAYHKKKPILKMINYL